MSGTKSPKKKIDNKQLTCRPLDTYNEILNFLQNPPPWRALCKEYTPHSQYKIKNMELNSHPSPLALETPDVFCHYNPNADDPKRYHEDHLPKTLVCHDMANGYHDDSVIDGTGNHDAYTFYNWAGIDIFCYFSHHLITIPPLGWINVGHAHGVKVIGTVITEWAEGIVFWDKILDSETEYENFASALVAIATTLKFDGWLLNVEHKIAKPDMLVEFVKHLHRILHQAIPHAVLIWYDSVTVQGNLHWQNGLTDKNRAFFNACDGIFTNYSWSIKDVTQSAEYAGDRVLDVFIGIDVWGRNFHGGGEFNTMEAVKVAYEAGCSLAIFAPAWTHEAIEGNNLNDIITEEENLPKLQKFLLRDRALWGSLWPFLFTRVPDTLPFQSSFCKGQGKKRRMRGEVLSPMPWYNLRHQQYQPNAAHGPHGYILSTTEKILGITRQGLTRKGILLYRESFLIARNSAAASAASVATLAEDDDDNDNEETTPKRDCETHPPQTQSGEERERCPRTLKRKMKNVLRNLFHLKSPRTEREEDGAGATEHDVGAAEEQAAGPSAAAAGERSAEVTFESDPRLIDEEAAASPSRPDRGRSMREMSLTLSLGLKEARKHRIALAVVPNERECLQVYDEDSFGGGSCLLIHPSDLINPEHRNSRLFHCDFAVEHTLIACVVTKPVVGFPQQSLNVKLYMKNRLGQDLRVVMVGRTMPVVQTIEKENPSGLINIYPLDPTTPRFRQMQCHLLLNEPDLYVPIENSFGWRVRYYEVRAPRSQLTSVNCKAEYPRGPIMLGHFGLCPWDDAAASE